MESRFVKPRLLVLTFIVLLTAPALYADPLPQSLQIRLSDGVDTVTITDQGGCVGTGTACLAFTVDISAALGVVSVSGSFSSWMVNVSTGLGFPFRPQGTMDLNSINATSGAGGGVLTIEVSQNGFNAAYPGFEMYGAGTLAGSGASAAYEAFHSGTNASFATTSTIGTLGPFTSASFNGSTSGGVPSSATYSLTLRTRIVASATGSTTYSGNVHVNPNPVPEPFSVISLGIGLAGIALLAHRESKSRK